ncbi:MAG: glycine betaine ABC transporter substrate-binding protein [bacterium]
MRSWAITLLLLCLCSFGLQAQTIRVGSKNFNESYILAEVVSQLLEVRGFTVERKFGLGGTLICYQALVAGEIDIYVEYTGTLSQAILNLPGNPDREVLNKALEPVGLTLLDQFGFNNTYAIAVQQKVAQSRGLQTIGDLAAHPDLEVVVSHEFLERADGWPGLSQAYGLTFPVRGIEHGLAYQAISQGAIGVTDVYSTDGELVRYDLTVLEDVLDYFPSYFAAPLVRRSLPDEARQALGVLANTITDASMQQLNAAVVFEGRTFAQVASTFLASIDVDSVVAEPSMWPSLVRNTLRHLQLTGIALGLAIVVGLGIALLVYRVDWLSNSVIYISGLMQTIPSIALLALMIPLFGIGMLPAIIALFLYSLLPILRNAITALTHVDVTLIQVSNALGLTNAEQLKHVLLPLSVPAIFAGIRTAAVISIGTATLAAFIGAGGLGDPIVVGLSLDNTDLILQGAIPAALLAIFTEMAFNLIEKRLSRRR